MNETNAKRALFQGVATLLDGQAVQWPNVLFQQPESTAWFAAHYMPVDNSPATLGERGDNHVTGFLQVDVNTPMGGGEKSSDDWVTTIQNSFPPGTSLAYGGTTVVITACKRSPGRDVSGFWRVSLTIDFYSRIQRNQIP